MKFLFLLLVSCGLVGSLHAEKPSVTKSDFGQAEGKPVTVYKLTNTKGDAVSLMDYGATITKIEVPDKNGQTADVVLGFDDLDGYLKKDNDPYFGATIGRYGNRIAKGHFRLDDKIYNLAVNNKPNALHGGNKGFDKQLWHAEILFQNPPTVRFTRTSPDGEEGYPGTLQVMVTYSWSEDDKLKIAYHATTDKDTVINLTNHSYFNLGGAGSGPVLDDLVQINANAYTPVDATQIPTGEIRKVLGTPFDFRKPTAIGARLEQIGNNPVGYDHNFVLRDAGAGVRLIAIAADPATGRRLKVYSDQPGVQFYTGNFLDGTITGKDGKAYAQHGAFCFEPQHFPDSPNEPKFPSVELRPNANYNSTIIYAFDTTP